MANDTDRRGEVTLNGIRLQEIHRENVAELGELASGGFEVGVSVSNWRAVAEAQLEASDLIRGIFRDSDAIGLLWIRLAVSGSPSWDSPVSQPWSQAELRRLMILPGEGDPGVPRAALELACRQIPNVSMIYAESNSAESSERLTSLGFDSTGAEQRMTCRVPSLVDDGCGQPFLDVAPAAFEVVMVDRELETFNREKTGQDDFQPLNLVYRDSNGRVIAGLKSVSGWEWLYLQVLWVAEQHRGRGLGSKLLSEAETTARRRGCRGACLSSYSFQAPEFYRKSGYQEFGAIEDYPPSHSMHFFVKRWQ